MIILCDQDTEPPEVPTIKTYEEFRTFVDKDVLRLQSYGVSNAGYFHQDTGLVANVLMVPCGAVVEYSKV
jgi:hypothetical protein